MSRQDANPLVHDRNGMVRTWNVLVRTVHGFNTSSAFHTSFTSNTSASGPVGSGTGKRLYGRFACKPRVCPHMRTAKDAFVINRRKTVMFAGNQGDFMKELSHEPFRTAAIG